MTEPNSQGRVELPDVEPYLQGVCDRFQQWQTLYTLTDAEGKEKLQSALGGAVGGWDSPFDFGLMVQTAAKPEREQNPEAREEAKEKIERFPVLEGIRKYAQDHVLLMGRPGSGKSTALAKLALEAAGQRRSIPVVVELRSWQGSIVALIRNALGRHGLTLTDEQLLLLWRDERLLLLFDGLNELPSEEARSQFTAFRQDHPKIPMIFTTRDLSLGGDFGIEKKLEMQPLTEPQMQGFVRSYIPEQAEQMLRQLRGRLRELGQTPLLLWMLCALFRDTGKIPENLGLVFRWFTQSYERKLKQDVRVESDREWWQPVLQQLAWVMVQGENPREKPTELRVAIARADAVRAIAQFLEGKVPHAEDFARRCLRDLQKYHLIQAAAGHEELEFRHQLIQEYYAAEALLERLPGLGEAALQGQYLNYLKWTESVALMLALVERQEVALGVVRSGWDVDLMLGARLAGEVKPQFQEQAIACLSQWMGEKAVNQEGAIALLNRTGSEYAIPSLLPALQDPDFDVHQNAAEALGEIGSERAIEALLIALQDQNSVRGNAAVALGKIGSERAIEPLLIALQDQDFFVRGDAAEALGEIGSERAFEALLIALQDQELLVRWNAAEALVKIGSERAIEPLVIALQDPDSNVRGRSAQALGKIGSERAIEALVIALQDQDFLVCGNAAAALDRIGSERAIEALVVALQDQGLFVRERAAEALGEIGSERAFEPLVIALQDQGLFVRGNAAVALGKIGSERAIEPLVIALQDPDSNVRLSAAEALVKIGSERAIEPLLTALQDPDSHVRGRAAKTLGEIGSERAIEALVIALQDPDSNVRGSAAAALGEIGSERAFEPLVTALQDPDSHVRGRSAAALGEIGSERSIEPLLTALQDQESDVRGRAAAALGEIGSERAIEALVIALQDQSDARWHAVAALGNIGSPKALNRLWQLWVETSKEYLGKAIATIQSKCQYYNHDLYQASLKLEAIAPSPPNPTVTYDLRGATIGNMAHTVQGDQISTQNIAATEANLDHILATIQPVIETLKQKYPVTTETEAIAIIDAEFQEIKQT
jgi:HEAT repeat protein